MYTYDASSLGSYKSVSILWGCLSCKTRRALFSQFLVPFESCACRRGTKELLHNSGRWPYVDRTTTDDRIINYIKAKPGPPTAYSMSFLPNLPIICGMLMYSWRIIGNCWIIPIKSYKPSMQHEVFFHLRTSVLSILNSVWNITLSYPSVLAEHLWSHSLSISYHLLESRTVFGSV